MLRRIEQKLDHVEHRSNGAEQPGYGTKNLNKGPAKGFEFTQETSKAMRGHQAVGHRLKSILPQHLDMTIRTEVSDGEDDLQGVESRPYGVTSQKPTLHPTKTVGKAVDKGKSKTNMTLNQP